MNTTPAMTSRRFRQIVRVMGYTDAEMANALHVSIDMIERLKDGREAITAFTADCIIELYQSR